VAGAQWEVDVSGRASLLYGSMVWYGIVVNGY